MASNTTGINSFAECLKHSAKPSKHSAKALPSVTLGKEGSVNSASAKPSLPRAFSRALGKEALCRVSTVGSRQRLTIVNFWTAADGPLPRAPFAECLTLGKCVFAEWGPVPSVQHSVKSLFAESLTLPRAALGKAVFAECPTKDTR